MGVEVKLKPICPKDDKICDSRKVGYEFICRYGELGWMIAPCVGSIKTSPSHGDLAFSCKNTEPIFPSNMKYKCPKCGHEFGC